MPAEKQATITEDIPVRGYRSSEANISPQEESYRCRLWMSRDNHNI